MIANESTMDKRPLAPLAFFVKTALCQSIALALAVLSWQILPQIATTLVISAIAAGCAAAFLQLSTPWILLNVLLPFGAASSLAVPIPHEFFLILSLVLLATYLPAFWTRVPYYPTQRAAYPVLLAQLPTDRPFTFVDIGCGFGDLLAVLAAQRPNGSFVGIEIGPLPFFVAKLKSLTRPNLSVRFQSMWSCDLRRFDYVYCFLSPAPMERLWMKAQKEMKPEAFFISNSFPAPAEAIETIPLKDTRRSDLFVYNTKN